MSNDQELRPTQGSRGGDSSVPSTDLDKVRDILFGAQMREQAERLGRMQATMVKEIAELRTQTEERLTSLETTIREELAALGTRLEREADERQADKLGLGTDIEKLGDDLGATIRTLSEQTEQSTGELSGRLSREAESLRSELARKSAEILDHTRRELEKLSSGKADRTVLSSLLTDLAARLTPLEEPKDEDSQGATDRAS